MSTMSQGSPGWVSLLSSAGPDSRPHLDVEPDLGELLLGCLRDRERLRTVVRVEDRLSAAEVAARERSRPFEVRTFEWIDVGVPETRQARRQILVREAIREWRAGRGSRERAPVDGEVHRSSQRQRCRGRAVGRC